jgi:hypothetical protein
MSEISDTNAVYGKTGSAASSSSVRDCPPHRPAASNRNIVAGRPLEGSAAGEHKVEISDGRGNESEPAGHADDEPGIVDEGEQVTGHSSVDSSSDGDSVNCPDCLDTFTTQEVATPDVCNHTFCASCLQEWSKHKNICPLDRQTFHFILVRHHLAGEILKKIPVELDRPVRNSLGWVRLEMLMYLLILFYCVSD